MRKSIFAISLLICASSIALASAASAQSAPAGDTVSDIVVTAQRRAESVQTVPITVTVVSGDQLDRQNIRTVGDLSAAAPSFELIGANGTNNSGVPTIRGIGTQANSQSSEGSVSIVIDGVPTGRARLDSLFDISRVEVLSGPQGIAFGKSASAGVVNITTNAPSLTGFSARAHADLGSEFDYHVIDGLVNIPIGDKIAVRIAAHDNYSNGLYHNVTQNKDSNSEDKGVRARLLIQPNDDLSFNFIGDYSRIGTRELFGTFSSAGAGGFAAQITGPAPGGCGITPVFGNRQSCGEAPTFSHIIEYGLSGQMDWTILGDQSLTAIVSHRMSESNFNLDLDQTRSTNASIIATASAVAPGYIFAESPSTEEINQQEIRLASPTSQSIEYIVGLYHSDAPVHKETFNVLHFGFQPAGVFTTVHNLVDADLESFAAYGQMKVSLSDQFRLIGGARYTEDTVDIAQVDVPPTPATTLSGSSKKDNISYKLGAEWNPAAHVLTYFTYSRGYKGPQVNLPQPPAFPVGTIVRAEIPTAYELGLKTSLFEDRLAFNVSLFHQKVKDFQGQNVVQTVNGPAFALGNIPSVTTKGVEVNVFGKITSNFTLNAGYAYTDAQYPSGYLIQCSTNPAAKCDNAPAAGQTNIGGSQLIGTPKHKLTLSGEYSKDINDKWEGYVQADGVFRSDQRFTTAFDPATKLPAYWLLGGRVGVRTSDGRWGVAVFGRNLTDERVPTSLGYGTAFSIPASSATTHAFSINSFRMFGLTLDARY